MKYRLTWGMSEYDENEKEIIREEYGHSVMERIERLIELGYTFFKLEFKGNGI
jgi:hypothetical protein